MELILNSLAEIIKEILGLVRKINWDKYIPKRAPKKLLDPFD